MPLLPALAIGLVLAWVDLRTLRLPDPLVFMLAAAVVIPSLTSPHAGRGLAAAAVVLGAGLLFPGFGFGDVKLAAVLAFPLGLLSWPAVFLGVLVIPLIIAGPAAAVSLLSGPRGEVLPFGPALVAGALVGYLVR